jgi:hypothetical protein
MGVGEWVGVTQWICWSVEGVQGILKTPQSDSVSTWTYHPLKWEIIKQHKVYLSLVLSTPQSYRVMTQQCRYWVHYSVKSSVCFRKHITDIFYFILCGIWPTFKSLRKDLKGHFRKYRLSCRCSETRSAHQPTCSSSSRASSLPTTLHGEQMDDWCRREIIYCKRAILSLSSSKILTPHGPHPPLRLASVSSPPTKAGGTHSPGGEGDGGSIFWKTREIGLPSYSK